MADRSVGGERLCGCGGMVDTLALGASGGNPVKVRVLSSAPVRILQVL